MTKIREETVREVQQMMEWAEDDRLPLWTQDDVDKLLNEIEREYKLDLSNFDWSN